MGVKVRCQMTWESPKKRWRKLYKGKLHVVSCHQLDAAETKDGSYRAANEWWLKKRAEIDLAADSSKPHRADYEEAIQSRKDMLQWIALEAAEHRPLADRLRGEIRRLEADFARPEPPPLEKLGDHIRFPMPTSNMPEYIEWLGRVEAVQDHRRWTGTTTQAQTVAAAVDRYLAMKKAEAESGQIRLTSYQPIKERLPHFQTYVVDLDAAKIDERTLSGFHAHLISQIACGDFSQQYASHILGAAKSFVRHLWRERTLEALPRNLDSLAIKVDGREIETFDLGVLSTLVDAASERTRLYLLLMMNCGFYQSDVAALKHAQIDWEGGTITRKRTKTERQAKVPTVSYLLWDETLRLLKKHRSEDAVLALTNENGSALVRRPLRENGRVSRTDNIKKSYERLCEKLKMETFRPLMYLRKTSSSLLETHDIFGRFSQYFLGQAPQSLAERRYAKPSPEQFDRAVRWLGLQYGYVTTR